MLLDVVRCRQLKQFPVSFSPSWPSTLVLSTHVGSLVACMSSTLMLRCFHVANGSLNWTGSQRWFLPLSLVLSLVLLSPYMLQVHHTTTRLSSTSEFHSEGSAMACVRLPGSTVLELVEVREENTTLFKDVEHSKGSISHCDELYCSPERLKVNATSDESPYCGIANEAKHIYGIPCYPEVTHLEKGKSMLRSCAVHVSEARQTGPWRTSPIPRLTD